MQKIKEYKNQTFDEERALYGSISVYLENCRIEGPADGESALKESRDVRVKSSYFSLRYPFWHNEHLRIEDSEITETGRAAIWYCTNVSVDRTRLHGVKAVRECCDIRINNCDIRSPEFGWFVDRLDVNECEIEGEYLLLHSNNIHFQNVKTKGKYSFQYIHDAIFENCEFDTKDAFWHAKDVHVKNCTVRGEYLGWYSDNVTFENCTIIGTQPLCYCKNLTLRNCKMIDADLAFEKSEVDAIIRSKVDSIKNPAKGIIRVPEVGELIRDDRKSKCIIRFSK